MKTAALLLLSSAVAVQGGGHMSKACEGGCTMQGQGCPRTQEHKTMMEIWGGPGISNPVGFLSGTAPGGCNTSSIPVPASHCGPNHGNPVQGVGQASATGAPFICKPSSGRRLAAHMAGTFRVAVAGNATDETGRRTKLAAMKVADYIKGLVLIDGSMDNSNPVAPAASGGRRLGAHAKTILMLKTWDGSSSDLASKSPCFDFQLPSAWGVTYLKAAAQRENGKQADGGLWMSNNVKVSDIPDCPAGMHRDVGHGRRLEGHAAVCPLIEMPASCLPTGGHGHGDDDDDKASAGSLATITATGAIVAAAASAVAAALA